METGQAHLPAHSPDGAGGQWASKPQSAPEVELTLPPGTFLFPPMSYPGGVPQYIEFWSTVSISDVVLSNLTSTYRDTHHRWMVDSLNRWDREVHGSQEYTNFLRRTRNTLSDVELDEMLRVERETKVAELRAERPYDQITSVQARSVAIAARICTNVGSFTDEDGELARAHKIRISMQEEPLTVMEVWHRYHLGEVIEAAFVDQDAGVKRRLDDLLEFQGATQIV